MAVTGAAERASQLEARTNGVQVSGRWWNGAGVPPQCRALYRRPYPTLRDRVARESLVMSRVHRQARRMSLCQDIHNSSPVHAANVRREEL